MIHPYNNDTMTKWGQGVYKVQINTPHDARPMGYCDGTPEDEAELIALADGEGVDSPTIRRKELKTGREIWTIVGE